METLVVGAGTMGRWFGRVLSQDVSRAVEITYLDDDPEVATDAARAVSGRVLSAADESSESAERFDVVCIAVPIPATVEAIETHTPRATGAIVDVTGAMTRPVRAMAEHAPDCERMSLHPLFAPENEPGNVPAVVDEEGPLTDAIREALERRGNTVFETTPEVHDEMMETVQAKTHAALLAFALAADDVPERFQTAVSAELTDLAREMTGGESRVYADIQSTFDGADDVARAAERIARADRETFERLYENA